MSGLTTMMRPLGSDDPIRPTTQCLGMLGEEISGLVQEQVRVLLLDTKHQLMRWEEVYQGTVDAITVPPAELLRPAVLENGPAVLPVHNHPSGTATPSPEDIQTTQHTMAAGKLLSIDVLGHVVLGKDGKYLTILGLLQRRTRVLAA